MCAYKEDLVLTNLQSLIVHKTQPNQIFSVQEQVKVKIGLHNIIRDWLVNIGDKISKTFRAVWNLMNSYFLPDSHKITFIAESRFGGQEFFQYFGYSKKKKKKN